MIKRPLKAPTEPIPDELLDRLPYPMVGSPKLDGFRCVVGPDGPLTSSMKPFQNKFVQKELRHHALTGLDGEIVVGETTGPDVFHNTSGPIRRFEGEPDFKLYVFDDTMYVGSYFDRWLSRVDHIQSHPRIVLLEQRLLTSPTEVLEYEREMLSLGYEGAMIRSTRGLYKEGRCTFNDLNIFKRKPFVDCEAMIVGMVEAMENQNEAEEDELGLMKRSHKQENMVPKGTLGSFLLSSPLWPVTFNASPGKGFTAEMKQKLWNSRDLYIGQIATVSYQKYGSRERPRMPRVTKIRPTWDMS